MINARKVFIRHEANLLEAYYLSVASSFKVNTGQLRSIGRSVRQSVPLTLLMKKRTKKKVFRRFASRWILAIRSFFFFISFFIVLFAPNKMITSCHFNLIFLVTTKLQRRRCRFHCYRHRQCHFHRRCYTSKYRLLNGRQCHLNVSALTIIVAIVATHRSHHRILLSVNATATADAIASRGRGCRGRG